MAKQKPTTTKKRHGTHHKKTKAYHSTYWPYIPVLLLIASVFVLALIRSPVNQHVLAFAHEVSSQRLLTETNKQRVNNNQNPLQLNPKLAAAAQSKAEDMAQRDYWSHYTPDGEQPWIFIDNVEYQYLKAGENLAYGFLSSRQTVTGWMNSPSHRDNMLDASFTEVGFGYVNVHNYQGSGNQTIVVALYAEPLEQTLAESETHNNMFGTDNDSDTVITMSVPEQNDNGRAITRIESLAGQQFAWMTFGVGLLSGTAAAGLFVSHGIRLRKLLKRGEQFVLHHPLLDVCLVSLLLLSAFLADYVGYIL